jgi:hypothetical protein
MHAEIFMDAVWIMLGLLAVVFGIQAAYRVRSKRAATLGNAGSLPVQAGSNSQTAKTQPDTSYVRDAELKTPVQSITEPDRDLQQESAPRLESETPTPPVQISPILPRPETEVPLAASLSVSELVQSDAAGASEVSGGTQSGESDSISDAIAPSKAQPLNNHEPYDVLEEIAQLGRGEIQQIDRLAHYINHPDSDVRVAVAFALGELAASRQGKGMEEAVPLLSSLSEDANLKVRLQAVIALGKIQSPIVASLLQQAETHSDREVSHAARNALQQFNLTD